MRDQEFEFDMPDDAASYKDKVKVVAVKSVRRVVRLENGKKKVLKKRFKQTLEQ